MHVALHVPYLVDAAAKGGKGLRREYRLAGRIDNRNGFFAPRILPIQQIQGDFVSVAVCEVHIDSETGRAVVSRSNVCRRAAGNLQRAWIARRILPGVGGVAREADSRVGGSVCHIVGNQLAVSAVVARPGAKRRGVRTGVGRGGSGCDGAGSGQRHSLRRTGHIAGVIGHYQTGRRAACGAGGERNGDAAMGPRCQRRTAAI